MKTEFIDRRGQVWEWVTSAPAHRYYVVRSWIGEHWADDMPVLCHELMSLNTGERVADYQETRRFEDLKEEMQRLL
jgi:hypothetical protein